MPDVDIKRYRFNTLASTIILLNIVFFVWVWSRFEVTSTYNFQLIGLLVIIYFLYHIFLEKRVLAKTEGQVLNVKSFIFTAVIILFISSTGGIESPFFFLLYFLSIGIALLLRPVISVFLVIALTIYFLPNINEGDFTTNLIKISSLLMIAPLAIFFARQYLKSQEQNKKILIFRNAQRVYKSELEKIQSDIALWTSFKLKGPLSVIKHHTFELLYGKKEIDLEKQKQYLKKIYDSNEQALEYIDEFEKMAEGQIEDLQARIDADRFKHEVVLGE